MPSNRQAKALTVPQIKSTQVTLCYPQLSLGALMATPSLQTVLNINHNKPAEKNSQDWQAYFLQDLDQSQKELPLDRLRSHILNIDPRYKTQVCCDLVAMQMTHRGAYLWGQEQLTLSPEDNQRLVDAINQKLMAKDERLVSYNYFQWMYLCEKPIKLQQKSYSHYIGRDMFAFNYQGEQAKHWQMLATEIQMLIKQMMDYEGLTVMPPEWIAQVHFSGNTEHSKAKQNSEAKASNHHQSWADFSFKPLQVLTDDALLCVYCEQSLIPHQTLSLSDFEQQLEQSLVQLRKDHGWFLFNNTEVKKAQRVAEQLIKFCQQHSINLKIIARDQTLQLKHLISFLSRLINWFKR